MKPFCCPKCGVKNPLAAPLFAANGSATAIAVICQHCGAHIPCPTCYGPWHEDYIACWTCRRVPDLDPRLTDNADLAHALQSLVRSTHHVRHRHQH